MVKSPCSPGMSSRGLTLFDEPPFYLRPSNSASSASNPFALPDKISPGGYSAAVPQFQGSDGAVIPEVCSEDFRSIIDDLTVEKRMLRSRIERLEHPYCIPLEDQELFEIRFRGLDATKRRKLDLLLEQTLPSLLNAHDTGIGEPSTAVLSHDSTLPKSSSSHAASGWPGDSAYASMCASEKTAALQPNRSDLIARLSKSRGPSRVLWDAQPRMTSGPTSSTHPVRRKMQLVVRRLEQLFTVRKPSAAEQGRARLPEESPRAAREARMATASQRPRSPMSSSDISRESSLTSGQSGSTPGQRPTRPFDLDRLNHPLENSNYVRHLGFGSPIDLLTGSGKLKASFSRASAWFPVNVAVNLAQLHTAQVTTEFVKTALREVGTRFELSSDGRSIRLKGGDDSSVASKASCGAYPDGDDLRSVSGSSPELQNGASTCANRQHELELCTPSARRLPPRPGGRSHCLKAGERMSCERLLPYKPPSRRRLDATQDDDGLGHYSKRHCCQNRMTGTGHSAANEHSGPVVFYATADFCVDFSRNVTLPSHPQPLFSGNQRDVIGIPQGSCTSSTNIVRCKGPISLDSAHPKRHFQVSPKICPSQRPQKGHAHRTPMRTFLIGLRGSKLRGWAVCVRTITSRWR